MIDFFNSNFNYYFLFFNNDWNQDQSPDPQGNSKISFCFPTHEPPWSRGWPSCLPSNLEGSVGAGVSAVRTGQRFPGSLVLRVLVKFHLHFSSGRGGVWSDFRLISGGSREYQPVRPASLTRLRGYSYPRLYQPVRHTGSRVAFWPEKLLTRESYKEEGSSPLVAVSLRLCECICNYKYI